MSTFALVLTRRGIWISQRADAQPSAEWEILSSEIRCETRKLVPALGLLLGAGVEIMRHEWLVYPSPFRWRALPGNPEDLRALLLDPRRIWLDSLLRALTHRAKPLTVRDKHEETRKWMVVDDISKARGDDRGGRGLGWWLAQALQGNPLDSSDPPHDGLNKEFARAWQEKFHNIELVRRAFFKALSPELDSSANKGRDTSLVLDGNALLENEERLRALIPKNRLLNVLRVFREGDDLIVIPVSPFDPELNKQPAFNETRVAVLVHKGGGIFNQDQAFWLAYHVAPIALVLLEVRREGHGEEQGKAALGFHNVWALPADTSAQGMSRYDNPMEAFESLFRSLLNTLPNPKGGV